MITPMKTKSYPNIQPILHAVALVLFLTTSSTTLASPQTAAQPQKTTKPAVVKKYKLRVTKGDVIGISLKADKAKITDVANDLAKRLGTRISLAPNVAKEMITVEFLDLPLEMGLRQLAPRVYVDYEIRANTQPKILGIYFMSYDDPDPDKFVSVPSNSQAYLVEGNTEDTAETADPDDPLQVELDDANRLTVKAKKQLVTAVVLTVAEILSIPAEIRSTTDDMLDTEFKEVPVEDAVTRLSPNLRLYVRADLTRAKRTPLRILLAAPETKAVDSTASKE
jgi:type II secretory pathway component GspD/PulD (secretin)